MGTEPPATLAVEIHGHALCLVAISRDQTEVLAQFEDERAATRFQKLQSIALASARAAGEMGL